MTQNPILRSWIFSLLAAGLLLPCAANAQQGKLECNPGHWREAASFVKKRVTLMKIAASKADFKNLDAYAFGSKDITEPGLENFLKECKGTENGMSKQELLSRVCDANCYAQRASVYLFRLSELPYLDSKGYTQKIFSTNSVDDFNSGRNIVKEGLQNLSLMSYGDFELETDPANKVQDSVPFTAFLRESSRLNAINARLLMATGDLYYQNVSKTRAEALRSRINDSLNSIASGPKPGTEIHFAETYYQQAFWVLEESMVDIPKTDAFSYEYFEISSLKADITSRLSSIKRGHLFLNIDPEAFSTKSSSSLLETLKNQLQELLTLEMRIEDIVLGWQKTQSDEQRRKLDGERVKDARSIELKGYQIAELEEYASGVKEKYEDLLDKNQLKATILSNQSELLDREAMLANLKFELAKTRLEVKNQIEVLNARNEQDLTALSKESHQERREEYKWLIDVNLTALNLDLQISQLGAQIQDFAQQQAMKQTEKESLVAAMNSRESLIKVEEARKGELNAVKSGLEESQKVVYLAKRRPIAYEICALEAEMAKYFGSSGGFSDGPSGVSCPSVTVSKPDKVYWEKVITLRKQYFGDGQSEGDVQKAIKKMRDCMVGATCGATVSEKLAIDAVYNRELEIFNSVEKVQLDNLKKELQAHIKHLSDAQAGIGTFQGLAAAVQVAGGIYAGMAGKTTGTLGPFPALLFDIGVQAKAAFEIGMNGFNSGLELAKMEVGYESEKKALKAQLVELELRLKKAEAEVDGETALKKLVANKALAEIYAQDLTLEKESIFIKADAARAILDAENAQSKLDGEKAKIEAQIAAFRMQLGQIQAENDLITYQIRAVEKQLDQADQRIQSLRYENQGLEIDSKVIDQDIKRIASLEQAAKGQKTLVEATKKTINGLNDGVSLEAQIVKDLRKKEESQISALTVTQIDQIEKVLNQEELRIDTAMKFVKDQVGKVVSKISLSEDSLKLTDDLNKELLKINSDIALKRKEMIEIASKPDNSGKNQQIFLSSEEVIANLTKGVPDYIRAKQDRLQYINFVYNLYRNRAGMLGVLAGTSDQKDVLPYIRNADQLSKAVSEICTKGEQDWTCQKNSLAFSEASVVVKPSTFTIPQSSGFMSRLLSKGSVRFEITPEAVRGLGPDGLEDDVQAMAANGYFMLWDKVKMESLYNMSVVTITLSASFSDPDRCRGIALNLRHLGMGARYRPVSTFDLENIQSSLAVTAPRADVATLWDANGEENIFQYYRDYLIGGSWNVANFPETINHFQSRLPTRMPFLGAPLVGTYEISFDTNNKFAVQCLRDQSLKIGISYTTPPLTL